MRKMLVFLLAVALLGFGLYWTMGELLWPPPVAHHRGYSKLLLAGVFPAFMGVYLLWVDFIAPVLGVKTGEEAIAGAAVAGPFEDGGAAYRRGDYATAMRLWRPLAEQGDALAQSNLGQMYSHGQGVPQDYVAAASWYRKAADQGVVTAQTNLGRMYDIGQGVPQDYAAAMGWYRKAADQGDAYAQYNLGVMYANGRGAPQDYAVAVEWYRKAADQGLADAQFNLGDMYYSGRGVPQDNVMAYMWFDLAATQGKEYAASNRDIYAAQRMTPAQIAEAQKLAREWKPKPER